MTHRNDCSPVQPRLVIEILFVPLPLLLQLQQLALAVVGAQRLQFHLAWKGYTLKERKSELTSETGSNRILTSVSGQHQIDLIELRTTSNDKQNKGRFIQLFHFGITTTTTSSSSRRNDADNRKLEALLHGQNRMRGWGRGSNTFAT